MQRYKSKELPPPPLHFGVGSPTTPAHPSPRQNIASPRQFDAQNIASPRQFDAQNIASPRQFDAQNIAQLQHENAILRRKLADVRKEKNDQASSLAQEVADWQHRYSELQQSLMVLSTSIRDSFAKFQDGLEKQEGPPQIQKLRLRPKQVDRAQPSPVEVVRIYSEFEMSDDDDSVYSK
jgi:hypothetical protein